MSCMEPFLKSCEGGRAKLVKDGNDLVDLPSHRVPVLL